jgi:hypothetical protein
MKRYIFQCLLILLIGITSCKKGFLDIKDTTSVNRETYVKDLASLKEFVNGIYLTNATFFEAGTAAAYPDIIADNLKPALIPGGLLVTQYSWKQQPDRDGPQVAGADPSSTSFNGLWLVGYQMARSCNFVIENAGKYRGANPLVGDNILGQAYALRALIYFKLVNVFAQPYGFTANAAHTGIPYITTSDISKSYTRNTVREVYDKMIADLQKAVELMPLEVEDIRNMNRLAAEALLARVYLFKEDYTSAKVVAKNITDRVPLTTIANGYPDYLFYNKPASQTEALFQIVPTTSIFGTSLNLGRFVKGDFVYFVATQDIADILNENPEDVRRAWVVDNSGAWNVHKFPSNAATEISPAIFPEVSGYYQCVIRSSEMFLTLAEAAAKTNDEETARTYLDAIRTRAYPAAAATTATGGELLDLIYKERRKELCFEGLRMFDLQRLKQGVHRDDAPLDYAKDLPYPSSNAIAPIPLTEVELSHLPQNENY